MSGPMKPKFVITQAKYNALQEECDGRMVIIRRLEAANKDMGERIAELEKIEKVESVFTTSKIKLISVQKEDIDRLAKQNKILDDGLEELSRLGNGDRLGNSDGNVIAQKARQVAKEVE